MKALESGSVDAVVDEATFGGYGRFFDGAGTLVNCSFGEPLLHPRFEELLDFFARRDKTLEISTNGQAFSAATVRALAGRRVKLFVSLDSASAETYRRLRNDRWHDIIAGLTVLREARRRAHGLPTLNMVFMPMRANVHDLEAFVRLCRMVEADTLMLRPLQLETSGGTVERGGYVYDHAAEPLRPGELARVFDACDRWCRQYGVRLVKQFDFGMTEPEQRHLDEGSQP
jgi:MoaA/NifB/PqqE/SkfB family radical SAM enzyme